jgi:hypothetical protein
MEQFDLCPECGDCYGDFNSRMSIAPNEMLEEYECVSCDTTWNVIYQVKMVRWETYSGVHEREFSGKEYDPSEPF